MPGKRADKQPQVNRDFEVLWIARIRRCALGDLWLRKMPINLCSARQALSDEWQNGDSTIAGCSQPTVSATNAGFFRTRKSAALRKPSSAQRLCDQCGIRVFPVRSRRLAFSPFSPNSAPAPNCFSGDHPFGRRVIGARETRLALSHPCELPLTKKQEGSGNRRRQSAERGQ
jgi:hypothetical protein